MTHEEEQAVLQCLREARAWVVRALDRYGRWIEWQSAYEMFDAEFVDCAIAAMQAKRAIAVAAAPKPEER